MLMDFNSHFFYAFAHNKPNINEMISFDTVKVQGRLMGFKMLRDTANPEFERPSFYIYIDSATSNKK